MKTCKKLMSVLTFGGLLLIGAIIVLSPQNTFSEQENRTLTTVPTLSLAGLLDGSYQSELSAALTDQFPMRNALMREGTTIKRLSGRCDIGDTYIGKDHYYFEKVLDSDIDEERYEKNLRQIETLAESFPKVDFTAMLVPSSGIVLSDKLPENAEMYDAESMYRTAKQELKSCEVVDPTEILEQVANKNQVYYRTDHHWTADGAYAGYLALMGREGSYGRNQTETVTDSFYGTLYSRTLDKDAVADEIALPQVNRCTEVMINGDEAEIYDRSKLKEKDKYRVFFGGNYGQVEVTGRGSGTLLIIKDSFANCFVPYLTADYERIIMIDPRYYPASVRRLMQSGDIDEVLVLYELNNFADDTDLAKLSL